MTQLFAADRLRDWRLLLLLLFTLYVGQYTVRGFLQAAAGSGLGGDQTNIALIELRLGNDELFQSDYAFADAAPFRFYTPSFVWLAGYLRTTTGDFASGLAYLVPIVMLTYLFGMARLSWHLTGNKLATLLIPLVSAEWKEAIGATFWGVAGIRSVMPRSIFLMFLPWLFWLFWRWREDDRWWPMPLVIFLVGITANFHPVSGFLTVQILLVLALLAQRLSLKHLARVILAGLAAILGAMPTLANFIRQTGLTGDTAVEDSFALFARVIRFRFSTVYPFDDNVLHSIVTPTWQNMLLWVIPLGLLALALIYGLGLQGRIRPVAPYRLFIACQLLLLPAYILQTDADAPILLLYTFLNLFLLAGVRFRPDRFRFWGTPAEAGPDKHDWFLLQLAAVVVLLTFVASGLLAWFWESFELWGLTSVVGEQIRGARLIYLPLYLWLARQLAHWDKKWATTPGRKLLLICLTALLLWRHLWLGASFVLLALFYWANYQPATMKRFCLEAVVVGAALIVFVAPLTLDISLIWLMWPLGIYLIIWISYFHPQHQAFAGIVGLFVMLIVMFAAGDGGWLNRPVYALARENLPLETVDEQFQKDTLALYSWAQAETELDALFFYDSVDFRLGAQRSISHAWKDLGLAYYTRVNLIPYARRVVAFNESYKEPDLLVQTARSINADFIVVDPFIIYQLNLPIAYRNASYTVYKLPQE